jgi:hypothetical protein
MEKVRRGSFPVFVCYKGPQSRKREGMLTVSRLRDVLEMKVSPTAVFHFVTNSSSDIGSFCKDTKYKKQSWNQTGNEAGKNKLETNLVLTQNTQADLTHNLFNVHLPPLVRIVDLSKPRITSNVTSRRTSCSNSRDRDSSRTEGAL